MSNVLVRFRSINAGEYKCSLWMLGLLRNYFWLRGCHRYLSKWAIKDTNVRHNVLKYKLLGKIILIFRKNSCFCSFS